MSKPPKAERHPITINAHGHTRTDEYSWLRAENWQACVRDPEQLPAEIRAYLEAENDWFEQIMRPTEALQQTLIGEMKSRIERDDESVPFKDGPWQYFRRYRGDDEHPVYLRKPDGGGDEQIVLDLNRQAAGQAYFDAGDVEVSPDHRLLAWSADVNGSEYYRLQIHDLRTGTDLEVIEDVGNATWGSADILFYSRVDDQHRPSRIYRHRIGDDPANDALVHDETDPRFFCSVWTSRSQAYVFIGIHMNEQSEIRFIPTSDLLSEPVLIEARTEDLEYDVEHQEDRFLILTNADGATDFKIVSAPVDNPSRANWRDLIAHKPGRMLLSVEAYRHWVMWMSRENALPRLSAMGDDGVIQELAFDEQAYALSIQPELEYEAQVFRYGYESPTTPPQIFSHDLQTGARELLKTRRIPCGHDPQKYRALRLYADAGDGEKVPVTVLHHRDTPLDGSAPCLLTGYGAYGASLPASFSSANLSLADRGFVLATAHVRGGQEKGRAWYEAARFAGKVNSFSDFIAVGEYLAANAYTSRGRIVIEGASAGGLLVGAALNRAPVDLWGGAIADVPFVDVLNTISDEGLPLTPGEWLQWGNPIESEQAFTDILGYSPYENVQGRPYPPMLVSCGVSDPRVTYWEAAKWVARHRALRSDDALLLLKTNMSSGHFGETGRFGRLADTARNQAFAIMVTTGLPAS